MTEECDVIIHCTDVYQGSVLSTRFRPHGGALNTTGHLLVCHYLVLLGLSFERLGKIF